MRYALILILGWACSPSNNEKAQLDSLGEPGSTSTPSDEPGSPTSDPSSPTSDPSSPTSEPSSDEFDCDGDYSVSNGYDCAVDFIECGDEITMSTEGGTNYEFFEASTYTSWYEISYNDNDYTGNERGFFFNHPGNNRTAQLTLSSPCGDTDLLAFHLYSAECPVASCSTCTTSVSSQKSGSQDDVIQLFENNPTTHMIVVEAPTSGDVPFTLKVECSD